MDLSIIIPSFNTSALLDRCLGSIFKSLRGSKMTYEVIVIDNASTDSSVALVKKKYPRVHVVRNATNVGYGKANNQGIRMAKGSYILLLNSDIVVQSDAIEALYRFILQKESVFAGGKLLNEDGSAQSSCGPFFTLPRVFLMRFGKGDYWGATQDSHGLTSVVDWVSGACIIGKASDFHAVGLFDEDIFMYMEEIDFLYRAASRGYRTYFVASASFIHTGAGSSGSRRTPVVNIYRGLLYFYRKHRSTMEQWIVRSMLRLKALAAIIVGRMIGKPGFVSIYEEALRVL